MSRPSPRTVEQRQACSIGQSFMCVCNQMCINCIVVSQARPHKSVNTHLVPQAGRSSVNPDRMPTAGLSSHPDSSWSELHGGFRCEGQATCRCMVLAASTLHPRVPAAETSTHLESASAAFNCGAAASLVDQSDRQRPLQICKGERSAGAWSWWQALST